MQLAASKYVWYVDPKLKQHYGNVTYLIASLTKTDLPQPYMDTRYGRRERSES